MAVNCVAPSVRTSYHRIMMFWQTAKQAAKQGEYIQPCSRREHALNTRTVALLSY
jgi:hypothetical protein